MSFDSFDKLLNLNLQSFKNRDMRFNSSIFFLFDLDFRSDWE